MEIVSNYLETSYLLHSWRKILVSKENDIASFDLQKTCAKLTDGRRRYQSYYIYKMIIMPTIFSTWDNVMEQKIRRLSNGYCDSPSTSFCETLSMCWTKGRRISSFSCIVWYLQKWWRRHCPPNGRWKCVQLYKLTVTVTQKRCYFSNNINFFT